MANKSFPLLTADCNVQQINNDMDCSETPGLLVGAEGSASLRRTLTRLSLMIILPWMGSVALAAIPGGTLDPTTIPKYASPLYIPPVMPKALNGGTPNVDYYKIAARQITQQVLPDPLDRKSVV